MSRFFQQPKGLSAMIPLTEIFCFIDDFCKHFEAYVEQKGLKDPNRKRKRSCSMSVSEIMTIIVLFHFSHYRTFKDFYLNCIQREYAHAFPNAVSYTRFLELKEQAFMPLTILIMGLSGQKTGRYFVDSTKLAICHNLRIKRNKVFKGFAQRGKTSTGWFFGFKLHLVLNDKGELMSFRLTPGNMDDRKPLQALAKGLEGWIFGDKGYIGHSIKDTLLQQGLELITRVRKNMNSEKLTAFKEFLLSKRNMIETTIDQLKHLLHIDHSRHRSVMNFQINVLGGLLAYIFKPKKVAVTFDRLNNLFLNSNLLTSS